MSVPKRTTGSDVELRARILRLVYSNGPLSLGQICVELLEEEETVLAVLSAMMREHVIVPRPDPGQGVDNPDLPYGLPAIFSR